MTLSNDRFLFVAFHCIFIVNIILKKMKKIIPTLLLFFATTAYCQDVSYIKTLDTIFVSFKEDTFRIKTVFPVDEVGFQKRWYTITLGNNYDRKFIRFYFQEYINPQKRDEKIKSDVQIIKKSFLKKHKNQIAGIDFFKNNDVCTLRSLFYNKTVYIIDLTKRKKEKPTLYEVAPSFSCDAIE